MRVADLLEHSAAVRPNRVAVTHLDNSATYLQLWENVCRLAQAIERFGVPSDGRIAILFENSIDYVTCFFAVLKSGRVVVPLDTSADPKTMRGIIQDCAPQALLCGSRFQKHLATILGDASPLRYIVSEKKLKVETPGVQQLVLGDLVGDRPAPPPAAHRLAWDDSPSTLAAIYYTSGSTGAAKGVMLSHRNLISNTLGTVEYLRLTDVDSVIVILPFYYIYGNSLLLTHVACGGRLVIDNRFLYPEVVLDTMEAEGVTGFSGVPSNFILLLGNSTFKSRALPRLRYFTQAGGAMAPEITRQLMDAFPHKEIWIMYGQTEAAPRASFLPPERLQEKLGSIGIAVPGVKLTIVDDDGNPLPQGKTGQIMVSGPNVMLGYWNQLEETAEVIKNGSLLTGDLARQDEDGYFFIVGRKKEIIKTGGNRVAAKEVEECLLKNEKILEASVFGVQDDILGEAIKAVVVLKTGLSATAREIQDHCKRHLAQHKAPKHVVFADSLPKKQSGKIDKQLLAAQYS
jgi:long-chain acyl-CoA synthetase